MSLGIVVILNLSKTILNLFYFIYKVTSHSSVGAAGAATTEVLRDECDEAPTGEPRGEDLAAEEQEQEQ